MIKFTTNYIKLRPKKNNSKFAKNRPGEFYFQLTRPQVIVLFIRFLTKQLREYVDSTIAVRICKGELGVRKAALECMPRLTQGGDGRG